ncbi:MAG: hypothetical protein ACK42G_00535 [Candidatus Kapaibacteriota bacterium]
MLIVGDIVAEIIQKIQPIPMLIPFRERESTSTRRKWSEYRFLWHRCSQCRGPPEGEEKKLESARLKSKSAL